MKLNEIKLACERKGISIETLAEKIGVTNSTLYRSLRSGDMKVSTLEKICLILDIDPREFFDKLPLTINHKALKTLLEDKETQILTLNIQIKKLEEQLKKFEAELAEKEDSLKDLKERYADLKEYNSYLKDVVKLKDRINESAKGKKKD